VLELSTVVLVIAGLLVVISALQPLAVRLAVPPSVLLAVVGVAIGATASFLLYTPLTDEFNEIVAPIVNLPVRSSTFLYVFLPLLLFHAALTIDVPRMIEDAAPILLLAVVAVVATTAVVGFSLSYLFGASLIACLLLGSIVATTDPAAVIAIFRDIGAPARLSRLLEGESLLNDAAAIALFGLLLGLLRRGQSFDLGGAITQFLLIFAGGLALGIAVGKVLVMVIRRLDGHRAAEATLTLAAPYGVFIIGEQFLHISGVVAVVALGLSVSAWGRSAFLPENWQHLHNVWEQIGFWAGSLIFMLGAILVPKLVPDVRALDALMILVLVAAALVARALVLFVLLPLLSTARLTKPVDSRYKVAILWGGLRGAITLALALAVVENRVLPPEIKRLVSVMATGFVLFSLLVNGTTLRAVIRALKLNVLTAFDRVLRDQVVAVTLADVRDTVRTAAERYEIAPSATQSVIQQYQQRLDAVAEHARTEEADTLLDRERLAVALIAVADRERDLILEHHGLQTGSRPVTEILLQHGERLVEATRAEGRAGYTRVAREFVEFRRPFRIAHFLHRSLRTERLLARQLANRFERLLVMGMILDELNTFTAERVTPLFGARIAAIVDEMVRVRILAVSKAVEALHLQYPEYAEALQRSLLDRIAQQQEHAHYDMLRREGLLQRELYDDLIRSLRQKQRQKQQRVRLDLGLNVRDMASRIELFRGLTAEELGQVCRLFRVDFAIPGEFVVRMGERGTRVYFISSGACEVRLSNKTVRLGRGEFFGELALLNQRRRQADIVALTYCRLLTLDELDFHKFLRRNPDVRAHIEQIAGERLAQRGEDFIIASEPEAGWSTEGTR